MDLKVLYDKYRQDGVLDSSEFLLEENSGLYSMESQAITLLSKSEKTPLEFCCLGIEMDRPLRESHEVLAVHDGKSVKIVEDVLDFLDNYHSMEATEDTLESLKHSQSLRDQLEKWSKSLFLKKKKEVHKQFLEDADRLSEYYHLSCSELSHRKKSVFFHNYYFEKEARIREEIDQLREEMREQEELLTLRYLPRFEIKVLFFGRTQKG